MNELFPIVCGILIRIAYSGARAPRWRRASWLILSVACGIAATVLSGEFKIGWEFVLIDVPLVAASAAAVVALRRRFATARSRRAQSTSWFRE